MPAGSWKRPDSVPFPSVWRRAVGKSPMAGGAMPSFVIQDVPGDRHADVVDFMEANYARHEPLRECMSFWTDALSIEELRGRWARILKQNMSVVAFLDDGSPRPRVVGANVLGVVNKGCKDDDYQFKGESINKIFTMVAELGAGVDLFERYGVQEYVTAMGLAVQKEFRGQGLGMEVLKGRLDVCKATGIKLTVTTFSAIEAQTLASKLGFHTVSEIFYEDYKVDGQVVFPKVNSKSAKLMAKTIE